MTHTSSVKRPVLLAAAVAIALMGLVPAVWAQNYHRFDESQYGNDYVTYSDQATQYYNNGELTKAIDLFKKAIPLAPEASQPSVYNNLSAAYIKRGLYYEKQKQLNNAMADYRSALFYIDYGWPEGVERKSLHENNRKVARENLLNTYRNLKISPTDKAVHMEMAKQLRLKGSFQEAVVEYAQVLAQGKNTEASKAIGDLFNVLNDPYKSKKYYAAAVGDLGAGAKDDVLVQLGNTLYKTGEVDKAIVQYNKALEINPTNASALNQLQKIWENEIKFSPNSVLGHANLAGIYQKKKMYAQAKEQYNAADHFSYVVPNTPPAVQRQVRLNMGTLFQEMKEYQTAMKAYQTVLSIEPNNLQANYYLATLYQETGNPDQAIASFNKVLAVDPNYALAHDSLLKLILAKQDRMAIASALKDYASRFAATDSVQAKVGEAFHEMSDYPNAATYYQNAIRINSNNASAYANLGAVYQALNKPTEAAAAYKRARELDPSNTTVAELAKGVEEGIAAQQYDEAVKLQQAGRKEEAKVLLEKALAASPDSPEIHSAYGITLQSMGQLDAGIREYQKALSLETNTQNKALYHYYLGTAYHQKKDTAKALAEYRQAQSLDSTLAEAKEAIGNLEKQNADTSLQQAVESFNRKRYAEALTLINKTLAADSSNAMAHYYKGLILNAQNNARGASVSYKEAIRHDPGFTDAYDALGLVLDTQKDTVGAKSAFQKFVDLSAGEDDFVRYAKERLQSL